MLDESEQVEANTTAAERALAAKIILVRDRARAAAKRLFEHRDPTLPRPTTELELLDLIKHMAQHPGKYGVKLMPYEVRALRAWDRIARKIMERKTEIRTAGA